MEFLIGMGCGLLIAFLVVVWLLATPVGPKF